MVGASHKTTKASYFVLSYLLARDFQVYPVNPKGGEILGQKVYPSLAAIPQALYGIIIFRASDAAGQVVEEALALSPPPKLIWMQFGVRHDRAAARARAAGLTVVMDRCLKQEWARHTGELGYVGLNSGLIRARRPA